MSYTFFGVSTKDEIMEDIMLQMIEQQAEDNRRLREENRYKVGWADFVAPGLNLLLPQWPHWGKG